MHLRCTLRRCDMKAQKKNHWFVRTKLILQAFLKELHQLLNWHLRKWKLVKICVQNKWRVLHDYISDSGGIANLRISHNKKILNLWKSITLEWIIQFCSNFHYFLFHILFASALNVHKCLYSIPLLKDSPCLRKVRPKFHEFNGEGVLLVCHIVSFDVVQLVNERHPKHEGHIFCMSGTKPWSRRNQVGILEIAPAN